MECVGGGERGEGEGENSEGKFSRWKNLNLTWYAKIANVVFEIERIS